MFKSKGLIFLADRPASFEGELLRNLWSLKNKISSCERWSRVSPPLISIPWLQHPPLKFTVHTLCCQYWNLVHFPRKFYFIGFTALVMIKNKGMVQVWRKNLLFIEFGDFIEFGIILGHFGRLLCSPILNRS